MHTIDDVDRAAVGHCSHPKASHHMSFPQESSRCRNSSSNSSAFNTRSSRLTQCIKHWASCNASLASHITEGSQLCLKLPQADVPVPHLGTGRGAGGAGLKADSASPKCNMVQLMSDQQGLR